MKTDREISKLLSLVLRHQPETIGITLDEQGWTAIDILLIKLHQKGFFIDFEKLEHIVVTNDKQRFAFNTNKTQIRANQGHSIAIDLELAPQQPLSVLYHGTAQKSIEGILSNGLLKRNRQYVHLSKDIATAINVGKRHGKPVVLTIKAEEMYIKGYQFYLSDNGVWLTEIVPVEFIEVLS